MASPTTPVENLFALAQGHHQARRLGEAEELYVEILRAKPNHADALHLLGTVLAQSGRPEQSIEFFHRAIQAKPNRAPYHVNLGVILQDLGKYDQAKAAYERAIKIDEIFGEGYYNLAKLFKQMELPDAALLTYEQLLSFEPKRQDALVNMGNIFFDNGQLDQAIRCFQTAIETNPEAGRLNNRALINLANTYRRQGEDEKAIMAYEQALSNRFHDGIRIKQATTLPVVYRDEGHIEEVRERFRSGLKAILADELALVDPALEISTTNFFLAYQAKLNRELQETTAEVILKACPALAYVAPHCETPNKPNGKIRVGLLSVYFRRHSIGRLMQGLIAEISKEDFEIVVFTPQGQRDAIARDIQANADKVIFFPDNTTEAQQAIAAEELDILFYADLGMDVRTYFLAFARLAPVQCVTWGHPDTTGIPNIDYFISSELIEPSGAEDHYSETLHQLKSLPTRYYPVEFPVKMKSKSDFGFSGNETLYLCPQSAIKHHPDLDVIFGAILQGDKNAVIAVVEGAVADWTNQVQERWRQTIPDVMARITVVPRQSPEDFIALQNAADVILDTPHFSGGNTSFEAFALGKPIVTLDGEFMRGRVTAGMYRMMGIDGCIATSLDGYIEIALKFGLDLAHRAEMSSRILEANNVLFNDKTVTSEFEDFFRSAITQTIQ
jgi:protein O-GlcNAc transferase